MCWEMLPKPSEKPSEPLMLHCVCMCVCICLFICVNYFRQRCIFFSGCCVKTSAMRLLVFLAPPPAPGFAALFTFSPPLLWALLCFSLPTARMFNCPRNQRKRFRDCHLLAICKYANIGVLVITNKLNLMFFWRIDLLTTCIIHAFVVFAFCAGKDVQSKLYFR